jgi:2-dehydro-3-deoxyphosphogluconate aldolase/(4S)-4-hydroxy-2-oxoglutarate aldolase
VDYYLSPVIKVNTATQISLKINIRKGNCPKNKKIAGSYLADRSGNNLSARNNIALKNSIFQYILLRNMNAVLQAILDRKIVAIIRGADPKHVLDLTQALYNGGVTIVEITMNSKDPLESIAAIKEKMGNKIWVGAGSVLDKQMAKAAIEAGSQFIISPSLDIETIRTTKDLGAISIPGAFTPTEIVTAFSNGADIIKVFPASIGVQYFADLRGPLPHIPLMPTGGIHLNNIHSFQKAGAVAFGIGGALVNTKQEITGESLLSLTKLAEKFVSAVSQPF